MNRLATAPVIGGTHWIDWLLIGAYAVGVLGLGWYYSRRQSDTSEYFTGGGRMSSSLIGISLFVTLMSTISYLASPGEIIKHGPMVLTGSFSLVLSYFVVGYLLIPRLMRARVTSAYELLEVRLGVQGRLLGACLFILLRLVWMSLMIYLTSSALVAVLGFERDMIPWVAAASGLIAIIYTSMGGLKTVVWTDLFQFMLLFGGAVITVALISVEMGGFGWFPTSWAPTWDVQPLFSLDPNVRVTVFGSIMAGFVWHVCTAGGDQTAVQRYMATVDARAARRAYLVTASINICVSILLALVGFSLLGYFGAHPEMLREGMSIRDNADDIFPYFIAHFLPVGLSGLVVAAMLAAAMSSLDSGVNSITAVVQTDFIDRRRKKTDESERTHLRHAKLLAFVIGVLVVTFSSFMEWIPGNFMEVTNKTTNLLVTPIFALFFLTLFVRFATFLGAATGCVFGVCTALMIAYWDVWTGRGPWSFQWIGPCALVVNLTAACLVSKFGPQRFDHRGRWFALVVWGGAIVLYLSIILSASTR